MPHSYSVEVKPGIKFAGWEILEEFNTKKYLTYREQEGYPPIACHNIHYKCKNLTCGNETFMEKTTIARNIQNNSIVMSKCKGCHGEKVNTPNCYYYDEIRIKNLNKEIDRTPKINIGEQYGMFKVVNIEPSGNYSDHQCRALIKCLYCGAERKARFDTLLNNACACECFKSHSSGEMQILNYLEQHNIPFISEYTFDDLVGIGGGSLRYDFAIIDKDRQVKILIEFDGEQHYNPMEYFGGEKQYIILHTHDIKKDDYAKQHSIPLIRLTDKDKNNINKILDDFLKR